MMTSRPMNLEDKIGRLITPFLFLAIPTGIQLSRSQGTVEQFDLLVIEPMDPRLTFAGRTKPPVFSNRLARSYGDFDYGLTAYGGTLLVGDHQRAGQLVG
jgi:hypothetical protein